MNNTYQTKEGKPEDQIIVDSYSLLVGFEVNKIGISFLKKNIGTLKKTRDFVQILSGFDSEGNDIGDYGHAFFYLTKNNIVECFFSFGPAGEGKEKNKIMDSSQSKEYADGYSNGRPSTSKYLITEVVRIFKITLTKSEFEKIIIEVEKVESKIKNGKKYRAIINDTCAEEAEDILDNVILDIPDGKGYVENNGIIFPFKVVNPYMWCNQFYDKYGSNVYVYPEYPELGRGKELFEFDGEENYSVIQWKLDNGDSDPLLLNGYYDDK